MIINLKKYKGHSYLKGTINVLKKMFLSLNQPLLVDFFSKDKVSDNYIDYPFYKIDPLSGHELCTSCGICAEVCPVSVIKLVEQKDGFKGLATKPPGQFQIDLKNCIKCGYCIEDCPEHALDNSGVYDASQISTAFVDIKNQSQGQ
jgi:formate hydrogenlyase subunit 6/NADH:ubiquinone oxidoreductase subunit I